MASALVVMVLLRASSEQKSESTESLSGPDEGYEEFLTCRGLGVSVEGYLYLWVATYGREIEPKQRLGRSNRQRRDRGERGLEGKKAHVVDMALRGGRKRR